MLDTLFVILFFVFPIFAIKYAYKIGLNIFTVSPPTILLASIFLFAYVGVFPLYFEWDSYRASIGITDKDILFRIFLFNCIAILGLLAGFDFSKKILKLYIDFSIKNISSNSKTDLIYLIAVFVFCFTVFLIYLSKIDEIALFVRFYDDYIGGHINKVDIVRSDMTNAFPGKYHWYNLFMNNILTVVTLAFFVSFLQKQKWGVYLFTVTFLLSSFIAVMTTQKAPFFWLLTSLFLVYLVVKHDNKISAKYFLVVSLFLFVALTVLYHYMFWASDKDIFYAIETLVSRIFTASIQPAYHYLDFFPSQHEFLYGRSFPNPKGVFPFETFNLTKEIMNFAKPEHIKAGIVGSMPTIFWAEAYANFGLIGVYVIPFIIGIIVWIISFLMTKISNTPIKIALYIWLILHFKDLSITGFSGYIIDFYLIFTVGVFLPLIFFKTKYQNLN